MLMPFVPPIIKNAWCLRITWFIPIWLSMTVTAALGVWWLVGHIDDTTVAARDEASAVSSQVGDRRWNRGDFVAMFLLLAVVACYVTITLVWEDFADSDSSQLTLFTLKRHNFPPPIWSNGRFFPLGMQEFNLLRYFTHSAAGYHFLHTIEFLVLSALIFFFGIKFGAGPRMAAAITLFCILAPSVVISFSALVCPESTVLFALPCLVLSIVQFEKKGSALWAVAAVVSAQLMIYSKEPAVLLLLTLCASRLLLRASNTHRTLARSLSDGASLLDLYLILLAILWFVYYAAAMYPHPNIQFARDRQIPLMLAMLRYLKLDPLAWIFAGVVLSRAKLILQRKIIASTLWDGLAFGGLAYFGAYICLRMYSAYYLAPVDLVAVLYLGRLLAPAGVIMKPIARRAGFLLASILFAWQLSLSASYIFQRKNVIHAKTELAKVVRERYDGTKRQRLFFPLAEPYEIMEFGSYLDYTGLPVRQVTGRPDGQPDIVLVSRRVSSDGRCLWYCDITCLSGPAPLGGDLVIVLPDDTGSLADVSNYRNSGKPLLSYEPSPRRPSWLYGFCRNLQGVFAITPSDRWLYASAILWPDS